MSSTKILNDILEYLGGELLVAQYGGTAQLLTYIERFETGGERISELELQFQRIDRMLPSAALDEISKIAEGLE